MNARVGIAAIGVLAPGLAGWPAARRVLAGAMPFAAHDVLPPPSPRLAAAERRRLNPNAQWALAVASEALDAAPQITRAALASVFASADGDGAVLAQTLAALAVPPVCLSPTLFHNSVFNAPAGYCSIAHALTGPSTSICAGEFTLGAALTQAIDQVLEERTPVLFVAADVAYPQTLARLHASLPSFACAMLLCVADANARPALGSVALVPARVGATHAAATPDWLCHWSTATVASALPLLVAIAREAPATVDFAQPAQAPLAIEYEPC